MFCPYCGKENVSDAAFCSYCGKSISTTSASPLVDNSTWEYCQIQAWWRDVSRESCSGKLAAASGVRYECYFWADALGKNGPYNAGSSSKYRIDGRVWVWEEPPNPPMGNKYQDTTLSRKILDNLVKLLINDGWELLSERGTKVWQYKFKRKISIQPNQAPITGKSDASRSLTKEEYGKLTYRQRFAVKEFGYLLSIEDAETVGKMIGNFNDEEAYNFSQERGSKVTYSE
jgi:hypothetical protein